MLTLEKLIICCRYKNDYFWEFVSFFSFDCTVVFSLDNYEIRYAHCTKISYQPLRVKFLKSRFQNFKKNFSNLERKYQQCPLVGIKVLEIVKKNFQQESPPIFCILLSYLCLGVQRTVQQMVITISG